MEEEACIGGFLTEDATGTSTWKLELEGDLVGPELNFIGSELRLAGKTRFCFLPTFPTVNISTLL